MLKKYLIILFFINTKIDKTFGTFSNVLQPIKRSRIERIDNLSTFSRHVVRTEDTAC